MGFVGYQALNFAASQDHEGIAHYYIQQKWWTTSLQTKQMTGFSDIDTSLRIQGKTTTFRHFLLKSVDSTGNCVMCNADYTPGGIRVIIFPAANEVAAIKRANKFNELLVKEFAEEQPPLYSLKQVPLGSATSAEDKKQVSALLQGFKKHQPFPQLTKQENKSPLSASSKRNI